MKKKALIFPFFAHLSICFRPNTLLKLNIVMFRDLVHLEVIDNKNSLTQV